jgi:exopolysaccharide biosynthesis polyprenyl glycosylphosphotransferase
MGSLRTELRPAPVARVISVANGGKSRHPVSSFVRRSYLIADIFGILASGVLVFCFHLVGWRNLVNSRWKLIAYNQIGTGLIGFLLLYIGLILLSLHSKNLYSGKSVRLRRAKEDAISVCQAVITATLLLSCFIYLSGVKTVSRFVVAFTGVLSIVVLIGYRLLRKMVVQRQLAAGRGIRNALIVGEGEVGRALAQCLDDNKSMGYAVRGFLDNRESNGDSRILGRIEDFYQVARAHFIDEIFITIPSEREIVKQVAVEARRNRIDVKLIPELYDGLAWQAPIEYVAGFPMLELHQEPISPVGILLKRLLDIVISATTLIILSPLLLLSALAIKLDSEGPVLYRSRRVGKKGTQFICYKFRTMVKDADRLKKEIAHLNERDGLIFKIKDDPRITGIGSILRKYSVDEIPQLWNVIKGDMSLVGPRPPIVGEYQNYSLPHLRRLDVMPGITGLWQVRARRDPSFDKYLNLDLEYIENWSIGLDCKILMETIPVVLGGTGE